VLQLTDLLQGFEVKQIDDDRFEAPYVNHYGQGTNNDEAGANAIVGGGQLLGQGIVAATRTQPEKEVKTIHLVFSRVARGGDPLYLNLHRVHSGGSYGTVGLTFEQRNRPVAKGVVMLSVPDPDLIRHSSPAPVVDGPEDDDTKVETKGAWDVGSITGTDIFADEIGPPELPMWVRFPGAPKQNELNQALIAYVSNFHVIGAAMRPHAHVNPAKAHTEISTGVNSHTITFHDPIPPGVWYLLDQHVPYAGRGRIYGRGDVFTQDGSLIASFVQDAMVRGFGDGRSPGSPGSVL